MIPIVYVHRQMNMQHAVGRTQHCQSIQKKGKENYNCQLLKSLFMDVTLYTGTMLMISDFLKGNELSIS